MTDQYDRLLALAKLEHELALHGDFEALERLDADRLALVAALPGTPTEAARPALAEIARIQAQTTAVLTAARARVSEEMASLDRREQTARGYGRQATPQRGTFTAAA